MAESIDAWYQRELEYLRSAGAEFAGRYGKIADRLSLSASGTQDPHVERLLQGVAFLNARVRQKLDDSFPELVDALLGVLYPHLVSPIPSSSILEFELDANQSEIVGGYPVKRGTFLESERVDGYGAKYQTCFPLQLYPLRVAVSELVTAPFTGPVGVASREVKSALHLEIVPFDADLNLSEYSFDHLQFFIDISSYQYAAKLMELLLCRCHEIVIANGSAPNDPVILSPDQIQQVGFSPEQAILPFKPQSFDGYRLLTEQFILPQKSLFFNLNGLSPRVLQRAGKKLDLWIYLTEHDNDVASLVKRDSLKLGCTPIVNLFQETADAIPVSINKVEYRVLPDARAEHLNEVYSIDEVVIADGEEDELELLPFYSVSHSSSETPSYWHAVRRPGPQSRDTGPVDGPTEMYLSFVDDGFRLLSENQGYLQAKVTCFNRLIPEQLSKRELSQVRFSLIGGAGPISKVRCLVSPTRTIRRHLGAQNLWPLVSQLSLNHLSLSGKDGALALKEILKLNDPRGASHALRVIDGVLEIQTVPCVERIGNSFARGTEVRLLLDSESFSGDSAYLFCCVLEKFLAMYSSMNSFTRLVAITNEGQDKGIDPWRWAPRTGIRSLI